MSIRPPIPGWGWIQSLLARFVGIYFALYCVATSLLGFTEILQAPLISWVGHQFFDITIVNQQNGSGDTTFHYTQAFTLAILALAGALIWSVLNHRPQNSLQLHGWLRLLIRYSLLITMISYGSAKAIKLQFPDLPLSRLVQPIGDSSPMGLLWTFMGYSESYTIFAGLAELVGGFLLISRRTSLLGALLCAAVMTNVLMLNLSYDVPVKLYAAHLLAMALILIAPDARRLLDFFILNRPFEPAVHQHLLKPGVARLGQMLGLMLTLGLTLFSVGGAWAARNTISESVPPPSVYGVWEIEQFVVNGVVRPPLLSDTMRWRRLIIDRYEMGLVQLMSDKLERYDMEIDVEARRITLNSYNSGQGMTLLYQKPSFGQMEINGTYRGQQISATLRRRKQLLTSRGFNWINEVPFNR